MRRKLWPLLLASALALIVLLSLGAWQVQRLAWKQGLLAELEASASAAPVTVAHAVAKGDAVDYLRVEATGAFTGTPQFMLTSFQGMPGWTVVAGLKISDEQVLLVDAGKIPEAKRAGFVLPTGLINVTGQVLRHANPQAMFDPDNNEDKGTWYWWDVPSLSATISGSAASVVPPFVLHIEPASAVQGGPVPQKLTANLKNNHLGYAITWFGLAVVLVVMTGVLVWRERQPN